MVIVSPDMSDEDIISEINAEINARRTYGLRKEASPSNKPWRVLSWSAGSSEWGQYWDSRRGSATLDANQIGVSGISRVRLESLLGELGSLPLGRGSVEARQRGEYSLEGIEIPPGLRGAYNIKQKELGE